MGKIKMAAEVTAILALILGQVEDLQPLHVIGTIALWVAMSRRSSPAWTITGVRASGL
jgi:hypothetical protein